MNLEVAIFEFKRITMANPSKDESFWGKYKRFATTEVLMYLIMVVGIGIGIVIILLTT